MSQAAHSGRVALVTGAARGIGRAIAERLMRDGAHVALVDRSLSAGDIAALPDQCRFFACDLGDPPAIDTLVADLFAWRNRCDIVVNNAGVFPTTPVSTITLDEWRAVFAVNVDAPMLLSTALAPSMARGGRGRIINIASGTIGIVRRDIAAYVASKMALVGLTRALASDLGDCGITVNAVAPGLTDSEGVREKFGDYGALAASIARHQAIGRIATVDDIAGAVAFLASDDAAMITGQTLMVDGGWVRL